MLKCSMDGSVWRVLLAVLLGAAPLTSSQNPNHRLASGETYFRRAMEDICLQDGNKVVVGLKAGAGIFSFSSKSASAAEIFRSRGQFQCHLELESAAQFGFHVFLDEMNLLRTAHGCQDYVQFGRDILFFNSYNSEKYCGHRAKWDSHAGISLRDRLYVEHVDNEMDIWLHVSASELERNLSLVVTTFRKDCSPSDPLLRACPQTNKCIRKEMFCDGVVNCAWPVLNQAMDELPDCRPLKAGNHESDSSTHPFTPSNIPVIIIVLIVLLALLVIFALACHRVVQMVRKPSTALPPPTISEAELPLNPVSSQPPPPHALLNGAPSSPPSYEEALKLSPGPSLSEPRPTSPPSYYAVVDTAASL